MQNIRPRLSHTPGPLAARFACLAPLTQAERDVLQLTEGQPRRTFRSQTLLATAGASPTTPMCIMTGWAASLAQFPDGRRQLMRLLAPGDFVALALDPDLPSPQGVIALTPVSAVEAARLAGLWRERAHLRGLVAAMDRAAAEDETRLMRQIVRLGRQTALERCAHLFLELNEIMTARNLSTEGSFSFSLTQEMLADLLGLSIVHINRTLQLMRREKLLELSHGAAKLLNVAALRAIGDYDVGKIQRSA